MPTPWFGVFLPQVRMPFATILERVRAAEAAGFDSVWFMDHLAAPAQPQLDTLEGWTVAAAIAARTSTIRIGHLVTCDPFRHPAVLAKMAATVDVISNGRLELGLGWGSVDEELRRFGISTGTRAARATRLDETLQILDRMFSGAPFDFDGTTVEMRDAIGRPIPVQSRVPIHIGGGGEQLTMPLVRRYADWWNCPSYAVDRLDALIPLAGNARVSVQHPVGLVTNDEERALAEKRFGAWGGLIVGDPEHVAAALSDEVARGVEGFVVQFSDFGTPGAIERFMSEVAPSVRS